MHDRLLALPGRCYWVVPGRFLAGSFPYNPGADEPFVVLQRLFAQGVNAFIDLTEEDELVHYQPYLAELSDKNTSYQRFAIEDYSVPSLALMQQLVGVINARLAEGKCLYLHCRGGVGRTGTAVGCWLCSQGYSGEAALAEVDRLFLASNAARFTRSPETEQQRDFVKNFGVAKTD